MKRRFYKVRLPMSVVTRLKKAANRNDISINQEITNRLQDSFGVPSMLRVLDLAEMFVAHLDMQIEAVALKPAKPTDGLPKGKQPHAVGRHG